MEALSPKRDHGLKDDLSRCLRRHMSPKVAYEAVSLTRFILSGRRVKCLRPVSSCLRFGPCPTFPAAACVGKSVQK